MQRWGCHAVIQSSNSPQIPCRNNFFSLLFISLIISQRNNFLQVHDLNFDQFYFFQYQITMKETLKIIYWIEMFSTIFKLWSCEIIKPPTTAPSKNILTAKNCAIVNFFYFVDYNFLPCAYALRLMQTSILNWVVEGSMRTAKYIKGRKFLLGRKRENNHVIMLRRKALWLYFYPHSKTDLTQ